MQLSAISAVPPLMLHMRRWTASLAASQQLRLESSWRKGMHRRNAKRSAKSSRCFRHAASSRCESKNHSQERLKQLRVFDVHFAPCVSKANCTHVSLRLTERINSEASTKPCFLTLRFPAAFTHLHLNNMKLIHVLNLSHIYIYTLISLLLCN